MVSKVEKKSESPPQNDTNKIAMAMIRLLLLVVLLGYAILWITSPTNLFMDHWYLSIREKINFTIYEYQGIALLLYTFPVMFVAVFGCLYLYLGNKSNDYKMKSDGKKHRLSRWRKPMLVRGPLGIVSGIEIAFLVLFIALLIWTFVGYVRSFFPSITPQSAAADRANVWEAKLAFASYILGLVGNVCLTFLFFPVTRGSSVLPLFGLTSESSIKYHIWLGHLAMLLFTAHGVGYIIYWIITNQPSEMLKWRKTEISNVAGEVSLLAGLLLWATTFPNIRRKTFELFFYTHYFYILFVVFYVFHVGMYSTCYILPGFYLFMVDRYLRFLQSRQRVRLISSRVLPCETLELNFSKSPGLRYNPTSILFLNVPNISKLQWHPFTISSTSNLEPHRLSVMIKTEGSWTKKLYQMLSSTSSIDRLDVAVEGPYGPASTHFLRYDKLVMVSGGSGITPFISIIKELIHASTTTKTPQVLLISAFKNSSDVTMLDLIIPISGTPSSLANLDLKIEVYVTREKQPTSTTTRKNIRTIWFKPNPTDEPITPILGTKSWLWLGAILAVSFALFLITIGLITHYYINSIDKNTDAIFSRSLRAFLNMLVLCICIGLVASFVFIWNKKRNARDAKQIQHVEGETPVAPPSLFYNVERELESLPHQSLVLATKVHYGERPVLKRMLFECKEESVGVLVCGPKKMRHEVAAICSSGLADNLHFESISFSW